MSFFEDGHSCPKMTALVNAGNTQTCHPVLRGDPRSESVNSNDDGAGDEIKQLLNRWKWSTSDQMPDGEQRKIHLVTCSAAPTEQC